MTSARHLTLSASFLFLAACSGQPQKWGTSAKAPAKSTAVVTNAEVERPSLPTACHTAGCIDVCERTREADACKEAGYALRDGSGVPTDFTRAAQSFDRACQKKDRYACHELAKAFIVGEGIAADVAKAVALYTSACDMGAGQACDDLAKLHEKGESVPKDHAKAIELLARGCVAEDFQMWTCASLKKAAEKKDKDALKVLATWKKSCASKDVLACRGLDRTASKETKNAKK